MPKDKSSRASASRKGRDYSYKPYSSHGKGLAVAQVTSAEGQELSALQDWADAMCPICMDFPHNAVLLMCSSHDKGCRPYMCDTSYRHSNCLDQYKKAHAGAEKIHVRREPTHGSASVDALDATRTSNSDDVRSGSSSIFRRRHGSNFVNLGGSVSETGHEVQRPEHEEGLVDEMDLEQSGGRGSPELSIGRQDRGSVAADNQYSLDLICPLCRGKVEGWNVVEAARQHLNHKKRTCAQESCSFSGTYEELRAHARSEHPSARPSEIDPARQRDWRRLERQRDLGDVLSTIRSAMPGAVLMGDYAVEGQDDENENVNDDSDFPGDEGHWWTVFLLFQVFGPTASSAEGRPFHSRLRGLARGLHRAGSTRRGLWGENLEHSGGNEGNSSSGSSDTGEQVLGTSHRRRRTQHRSQGDLR